MTKPTKNSESGSAEASCCLRVTTMKATGRDPRGRIPSPPEVHAQLAEDTSEDRVQRDAEAILYLCDVIADHIYEATLKTSDLDPPIEEFCFHSLIADAFLELVEDYGRGLEVYGFSEGFSEINLLADPRVQSVYKDEFVRLVKALLREKPSENPATV
jgi:hypothetical protein